MAGLPFISLTCFRGNMLHLERLKTEHHPMYKDAMALYDASFPYHERRETKSQLRILRDGEYHFTLLWDGDTFVGLALYLRKHKKQNKPGRTTPICLPLPSHWKATNREHPR